MTRPLGLSVLDQSPIAEGAHRRRGARATRRSRPARRRARLRALLGRRAPRHADARVRRARDPDRRDRRGDDAHPRRQRRRDAAALQPVQGRRDFSMLGGLHGDRIDLGIGRAPGTDRETMFALQRDRRQLSPDDFPEQLAELLAYLEDDFPRRPSVRAARRACPGAPGSARRLAARLVARRARSGRRSSGLPYSFADFINPGGAENARALPRALRSPRERARASPSSRSRVAVDLRRDRRGGRAARRRAGAWRSRSLRRGQLDRRCRRVERALAFLASRGRRRRVRRPPRRRRRARHGAAGLEQIAAEYGADEVMVVTITHDHAARRRSYELLAEAFGLG